MGIFKKKPKSGFGTHGYYTPCKTKQEAEKWYQEIKDREKEDGKQLVPNQHIWRCGELCHIHITNDEVRFIDYNTPEYFSDENGPRAASWKLYQEMRNGFLHFGRSFKDASGQITKYDAGLVPEELLDEMVAADVPEETEGYKLSRELTYSNTNVNRCQPEQFTGGATASNHPNITWELYEGKHCLAMLMKEPYEGAVYNHALYVFGPEEAGSVSDIIDALYQKDLTVFIPSARGNDDLFFVDTNGMCKAHNLIKEHFADLEKDEDLKLIGTLQDGIYFDRLGELGKMEFEQLHNYYICFESKQITEARKWHLEHDADNPEISETKRKQDADEAYTSMSIPDEIREGYGIIKARSLYKAAEFLDNSRGSGNIFETFMYIYGRQATHLTQVFWDYIKNPAADPFSGFTGWTDQQKAETLLASAKNFLINTVTKEPLFEVEYLAPLSKDQCREGAAIEKPLGRNRPELVHIVHDDKLQNVYDIMERRTQIYKEYREQHPEEFTNA